MAASTYFDQIQQLYIAYFGRPADPVGLSFWANQVDAANGSVAAVIAGFAASLESNALYAGVATAQKVSAIYLNLFNRLPEAGGLAYWVQQIDSGTVSQAQVAYQIQSSAGPGDASAVANKLAMAKAFTAQIDTGAEITGYNGAVAAAYGRAFLTSVDSTPASVNSATASLTNSVAAATGTTVAPPVTPGTPTSTVGATYVLTTSTDNLTAAAGDDTFTGTLNLATPINSTLNVGDSINGGAGNDTLSLTVTGAGTASLPGATISNIEKLLIRDLGTGTAPVYAVAGLSGLTTVLSNASTRNITVTGVSAGTKVGLAGDNVTSVGGIAFTTATPTDAVNLLFDGGVKGTATVTNTNGTPTTATISSTGAGNTVGVIALNSASSNTITNLTINATADLKAVLTATDYSAIGSLTVTGAGKVDLGSTLGFDGSTINAAANSGGLTIALDSNNITSFIGGTGADVVSGTARLANAVSIDGGAGIDTLSAILVRADNASVFSNFELLDLAGGANGGALDVTQLTHSSITGIVLSSDTVGTVVLNNLVETAAGFNVSLTANSPNSYVTLNFRSDTVAGSNDVLNYNVVNVGAAGLLKAQGIETIKINSGGLGDVNTRNSLSILDDSLRSMVITGDHALELGVTAQNGLAGVSQLSSIDGSTATGNLIINTVTPNDVAVQSALTIKTGSGSDSIIVATSDVAGSVGSTVTSGTGIDNISLSRATVQSTTAPQFTTITDVGAGDRLSFVSPSLTLNPTAFVPNSPTSLADALTQASVGLATNAVTWFSYETDTYVIDNKDGVSGFSTGDIVVKLTGTVSLANSVASSGVISYHA